MNLQKLSEISTQPSRRAVVLALALVLAACSGTATRSPDRVAFPRGERGASGAETEDGALTLPPGSEQRGAAGELEPVDDGLFSAVRAALERGDWMAARLALPRSQATDAAITAGDASVPASPGAAPLLATELWTRYYQARIAHLRGDLEEHTQRLDELRRLALPAPLELELLDHELFLAMLREDWSAQFALARRLEALGGSRRFDLPAARDILWQAAQHLRVARDASEGSDPIARGWLDLAASARSEGPARDRAAALQAWLNSYPQHPGAEIARALGAGVLEDAAGNAYSLLLPLSGALAPAGDAVAQGAFAAFYAEPSRGVALDVTDSRRFDTIEAALGSRGDTPPAVTLGPLGKRQVAELIAMAPTALRFLALNRPELPASATQVMQLALAPEDEARQLAELAFADGARRVLLIRPEGVWGDRIGDALLSRWSSLGGQTAAIARYDKAAGYSGVLREALGLDGSDERSRRLRGLFVAPVETSGRRRDDLDAVFLLTPGSDEARALKPLLDYHYAGDLPTYALSTIDAGGVDPARDGDLEGLRLLAMPWRVGRGIVPGLDANRAAGSFDALHALGVDAYRVARQWSALHSSARPVYQGLTAELRADTDGVLRRRLVAAEFDRGRLRPR
ncbi:MAG: penicillin-binding protein activator [Halieaceae bacterium]|jgi:outer membrane PBP1 activator LpoA protein|nr:penicillin-binding protein activator [Halieaceae bacterium]